VICCKHPLPQHHLLMSQDSDSCCGCDAVLSSDQINCYLCPLTVYILAVSTAWSLNTVRQRCTLSKTFSLLGVHSDFQSLRTFLIPVETLWWCVRSVFAVSIIVVKPVSTICYNMFNNVACHATQNLLCSQRKYIRCCYEPDESGP
jgi:hypothetical protein